MEETEHCDICEKEYDPDKDEIYDLEECYISGHTFYLCPECQLENRSAIIFGRWPE